ncbi:hypothetical protein FCY82_05560 [Escherichia coli]|uniref:WbuO n=1 Tax=Escherichia coli TaxID=562 RepID=Q697D7_ECOLX|nr:WbuO [Escherichia coli]EMV46387.1 putative membrane protein [Escherichia coli 2872800]EMV72291.1 putative membrane protein [Escherichia coli 2866550]EMV73445.1 putative membrane protein [Escherichia coli 2866450]EMV76525.1 putative membrane protein [Escherichia coli 2866750]EMW03235.1 putative membrane protein [Escherichia coli 2851500]EMW03444.1 putative membrane protein [Escherichia coli 2853500]EMW10641.1 putative membrane protein [Escherichia coli 2850750]EMW19047.1 putative membrane
MFMFYLPFVYYYKTRLRYLHKLLSWMLIYLFPLFFSCYLSSNYSISILSFCLFIILVQSLYEVGYIQNDCETIKKEDSPTLRLTSVEFQYYENNKFLIYSSRLVFSFILSVLLSYFVSSLVWAIWFILPIFYVYNNVRNRFNLILHFLLVFCRYCLPVLCLTGNYQVTLMMIFVFPLLNLIERMSEKKFKFQFISRFLASKLTLFRALYYLFFLSLFYLISINCRGDANIQNILYLICYYSVYRFSIYFFSVLFYKINR